MKEVIKTPLIELGIAIKRVMDGLRKMMEDFWKAISKALRKIYDSPIVVEFIKKKVARKAKYYRRMDFCKQQRKWSGRC